MPVRLNCLLASITDNVIYSIEIEEYSSLSNFIEVLKRAYFLDLERYTLWKVDIPLNEQKTLRKIKNYIPFGLAIKQLLNGIQLHDQEMKLETIFPGGLIESRLHLVVQIQPVANNLVYVFVDDTNLFIQGKYVIGVLEQQGVYSDKRKSLTLNEFRVEHKLLYNTLLDGREKENKPVIVGSRPPDDATLWNFIQQQDYEVIALDRNARNREKSVDTALGHEMDEVIFSCPPGILVLVSGDRDYCPFIKKALDRKWNVEIWFWKKGTSTELKELTSRDTSNGVKFIFLEDHYKKFTFACVTPTSVVTCLKSLHLTGDIITSWRSRDILECFQGLGLFGWLEWINDYTINLYFKDEFIEPAKRWIEENWVKKDPSLKFT